MAEIRTETLRNASAFVRYWDEVASLRREAGLDGDVLLDPLHFLASTDETRRSCSVACWRDKNLIGVMYATEHYVHGLRSGYAVGGDYSGRGLLLCRPLNEAVVLKECVRQITADGVHSLHLRLLPQDNGRFSLGGFNLKFLDSRIPGDRMELAPTYFEFLNTLGKHTRRNVRSFTRKTEEIGIEFVPSLTKQEYEYGVERLNAGASFRAEALRLARDERLLTLHSGGERLGLRGPDGNLVAVLCGFRRKGRFHMLTQLNDIHYERLSLSLVLRGYTVRHLIQTGCSELQFMGGSSLSFGRYCQPEMYRSIFIDRREGFAAAAKMVSSRLVTLMTRLGRPIPEKLALISGGSLEDWMLSERTALRPAAMLFQQREPR